MSDPERLQNFGCVYVCVCIQFCGPKRCPLSSPPTLIYQDAHFLSFPYLLQVEELLMAMEKVKQELESMKAKLSSTQQSLAEKETHLTNLRAERRKHLEEVLEMK